MDQQKVSLFFPVIKALTPKLIAPLIIFLPLIILAGGGHRLIPDNLAGMLSDSRAHVFLLAILAVLMLTRGWLTFSRNNQTPPSVKDRPHSGPLAKPSHEAWVGLLSSLSLASVFLALTAIFRGQGLALELFAIVIFGGGAFHIFVKGCNSLTSSLETEQGPWKRKKVLLEQVNKLTASFNRLGQVLEDLILFGLLILLLEGFVMSDATLANKTIFFLMFRYFCRFANESVKEALRLSLLLKAQKT